MNGLRVDAHPPSMAQLIVARLGIGVAVPGLFFAGCVLFNHNNPRFMSQVPALGITLFGTGIGTSLLTYWCIDRQTSRNDGYNEALLKMTQPLTPEVPYEFPPHKTPSQLPLQKPVASNVVELHPPTPISVSTDDGTGDDLSFLDASC